MDRIEKIKQESIKEFGSDYTQNKYKEIAERGLWESEEILIDKYFMPRQSAKSVEKFRRCKILDIGCGSGRTTFSLYEKNFDVIGVDITPEMISTAKQILQSKNYVSAKYSARNSADKSGTGRIPSQAREILPQSKDYSANEHIIEFRIGDATNLEFPDNYFDCAIFANNGWGQIPGKENRQKALDEIRRVLKPGGCFIFTTHQRYYSGYYLFYWVKEWIKFYVAKLCGFKISEIDFGDMFFNRSYDNAKQYIHLTSRNETEEQIKNAEFVLEERKSMAELSKKDADTRYASLTKNFNSHKSTIFYICKKAI